jgi:PTS system mannose-specific IIB component
MIRVDNRLIHGQIIEAWLPFMHSTRIVVVNDDVARDPFRKMVLEMAVPHDIEVLIYTVEDFSRTYSYGEKDEAKTIVLFSTVIDVLTAYTLNFQFKKLNIGNVHSTEETICFAPSIFLNECDIRNLMRLMNDGVTVEVRSVPNDKAIDFRDIATGINV